MLPEPSLLICCCFFLLLLQAAASVSAGYLAAFRRVTAELESVIGDCQFSTEGMVSHSRHLL
jgi:hypothetical protein